MEGYHVMIKDIAHVCYMVGDLEKSIQFYCGSLRLRQAFEFRDEKGKRFGVYVHVGGRNFIELFEGILAGVKETGSYRHLCLEVDNIKDTMKELREQGIDVSNPKMGEDGSWQAWLADPDGNQIELQEYTTESKQEVALRLLNTALKDYV
jgi:catechol 2,3-dioxygenase-like lactoylglutathione lyase family enzyme